MPPIDSDADSAIAADAQAPADAAIAAIPKSVFRAKLDGNGIYQGFDEITARDVVLGDVILPHAPDNEPGKYRWNAARGSFDPLPPDFVVPAIESNAQLALYALIKALAGSGLALPDVCTVWAAEYAKTIDAQGVKI